MKKELIELIRKDCAQALEGYSAVLAPLKSSKILITGGTGFMGTWLTEMLTFLNDNHGFNVKIVLMSRDTASFTTKAAHLSKRKDISLVEKDVVNLMEIDPDVTYVIHAAADPDNRVHASDPLRIMNDISKGTDAVLAVAARLSDLRKFVNISSGLIYGAQPENLALIPETFHGGPDSDSIMSVYSEAKRFAETLCAAYRNQFKMPIVTARPFAFIGPYQLIDKPWAINNFISDALRGGPIKILGNGNTVRSYMYPSDMAMWLLKILTDGKNSIAYNIGSSKGITLTTLASKIAKHFPEKIEIVSDSSHQKPAFISRFVPDTSLARESLKLRETVDIDEALKRTIFWNMSLGN